MILLEDAASTLVVAAVVMGNIQVHGRLVQVHVGGNYTVIVGMGNMARVVAKDEEVGSPVKADGI